MSQAQLLLLGWIVTIACPQDVPAEGAAIRQVEVPPLPGHQEPEPGEEERGARCRLRPIAPGVPDDVGTSRSPPASEELLLVPEGVAVGAALALVEAPEPGVECRLEAEGKFGLRETPGGRLTLVTVSGLDREQRSEHKLGLVTERRTSAHTLAVTVRVTDENDNPPVFVQSAYRALVMENGRSNRTVLTVKASDRDLGANGRVTYSIVSRDVPAPVGVHPTTGDVYTLVPFDYERARSLDVVVEAQDGGTPPARAAVPVRLDIGDVNDNSPVFTEPEPPRVTVALLEGSCRLVPVTAVKAVDADSGRNGELVYELAAGDTAGVFHVESGGELRANVCGIGRLLDAEWRVGVRVRDRGSPSRSASTVLTVSFVPAAGGRLGPSAVAAIALGTVCATLLPALLLLLRLFCGKRRRDGGAYNCRRAESDYGQQPRHPERTIRKADIALLPRSRAEPEAAAARTLLRRDPDSPRRRDPDSPRRRDPDSPRRQLLRELVRLSRAGCPDGSLELAAGSPHVQQISQLLSLLHQGQFQARPNFRGNKYLKNYRATVPEGDRASLKDSGQGESEEGDSDSETGRTSPIDQLLETGLSDLLRESWTTPTGARASTGEQLSIEELCWRLSSTLSSDYKENVFNPRSSEATETLVTIADGEKTTFSTFGKGAADSPCGTEQPTAGGSLLTEMSVLFQQLLSQKAEAYSQPSPELLRKLSARWSIMCEGEVASRWGRGRHLPGLVETPEQRAGSEQPHWQLD